MRFPCKLPALAVALLTSYAAAQSSPCTMLLPADLRQLTGLSTPPQTHIQSGAAENACVYSYPNGPAPEEHDDTDENGRQIHHQDRNAGASLVVTLYRFTSVAAAQAKLAQRGMVVASHVLTDSPVDTDQVGDLERQEQPGGNEFLVLQGATARHGTTVAVISYSEGFGENTSVALLQSTALRLAGAHVLPGGPVDACARIPGASLQTLVSLHASSIALTSRPFKDGVSSCVWTVEAEDLSNPATLTLSVQSFLTSAEAVKAMDKTANQTPLPHTADPTDKAVSHRGASPGVVAVHSNQFVAFNISAATADAKAAPGYNYRLERTALTAAGASFPPDPAAPAVLAPQPFTATESLSRSASEAWGRLSYLSLPMLFLLYYFTRGYRRRQLRANGLHGTARIDSMSDTGITVNNSPRVRVNVTITPPAGNPYPAQTRMQISRFGGAELIGQIVSVRIDPRNPQRFLIV